MRAQFLCNNKIARCKALPFPWMVWARYAPFSTWNFAAIYARTNALSSLNILCLAWPAQTTYTFCAGYEPFNPTSMHAWKAAECVFRCQAHVSCSVMVALKKRASMRFQVSQSLIAHAVSESMAFGHTSRYRKREIVWLEIWTPPIGLGEIMMCLANTYSQFSNVHQLVVVFSSTSWFCNCNVAV